MAGRKKITDEMSLFISRSYDALERYGHKREAICLIKDDVFKEFGENITKGSIRLHAYNTPEQLREKRRDSDMETLAINHPERAEFLKSFQSYKKGIKRPINDDNKYLIVLKKLTEHEFPIKGKHLAQDLGITYVGEQLAFLKRHDLIKHPALQKNETSLDGKKFLKFLGLIP